MSTMDEAKAKAAAAKDKAKEAMEDARGAAERASDRTESKAENKFEEAKTSISEANTEYEGTPEGEGHGRVAEAKDKARSFGERVRGGVERATDKVKSEIDERRNNRD